MSPRMALTVIGGLALTLCSLTAQADAAYTPRVNYILHCQGCHLPDGSGTPGKVPALKDEVGRFLQVAGGRAYLIQVPGTAQSALTDAEVAAVLNWMLENFSKEATASGFSPYTTDEVSRLRRQTLANVSSVRSGLIAEIAGKN